MDGAKVVCIAHTWLGTPYVHQASLKGVGSDCLGLVRGVWREVEGSEPQPVPSYSSTWSELDGAETLLRAAKRHFVEVEPSAAGAGDVLIFRLRSRSAAKHAGIVSDAGRFIHAYQGSGVVESPLDRFWSKRIAGVFRFPAVSKMETR